MIELAKKIGSLTHNLFPRRYFQRQVRTVEPVPAYFYHQIDAAEFEQICKLIVEGGFQALTINQLLDRDFNPKAPALLLTMDDGWSSVWSIAFPIARRYGIRFTLFLVPEAIEDSPECRSTLDDGADVAVLSQRDLGDRPMLTWAEVQALSQSGWVEIQSHSLNHGMVFTSASPREFSTPTGSFPRTDRVPVISQIGDRDVAEWKPPLGTPVYTLAPALVAPQRFIENETAREHCIAIVRENGGEQFFQTEGWRQLLQQTFDRAGETGHWEGEEERRDRYRQDLTQAKDQIETRLSGVQIRAFAPPWGAMHPDLSAVAQQTGHELLVLADPLPQLGKQSKLPIYPRLKGNAIWILLQGPILGTIAWLKANRRSKERIAKGAIP